MAQLWEFYAATNINNYQLKKVTTMPKKCKLAGGIRRTAKDGNEKRSTTAHLHPTSADQVAARAEATVNGINQSTTTNCRDNHYIDSKDT